MILDNAVDSCWGLVNAVNIWLCRPNLSLFDDKQANLVYLGYYVTFWSFGMDAYFC